MPLLMFVPLLVLLSALMSPLTALAQTAAVAPAATPTTAGSRHFAVTLLSSFEPIPDALLPADLKTHRVYRTRSEIFGKTIYFVRLGFFATAAEATAMRDELVARYPGAFMTEVTAEEFGATASVQTRIARPAAQPSKTPAPRADFYVVTLAVSDTDAPAPAGLLPAELKNKRIYRRDSVQNGTSRHSLLLGFFASAAEAETARKLLLASYPQASVRQASQQERDESGRTVVVLPAETAAPAPKPAKPALPLTSVRDDVDSQASNLLEQSRAALTRGDNTSAIQLLTKLLQLPPNRHSQDAQELIGLAHERNGEIAKAKREYALCLELYPDWSGAERVRQRLAELETALKAQALTAPKKKEVSVSTAYGSFSQYYYRGNSRVDTTETPIVGPPEPLPTLTSLDQSALISNLDLTGRFRSGDYDNRVVIRDSYALNFLPNTENENRLYAAYAEVRNKLYDYSGRLGRQPGNSGGVLGRFDGVSLGYSISPKWRVNVVAGEPVEFNPINSDKQFWGTSLDLGTFAEHWNGSTYYINQTVDGIIDRQAVGAELRYFDPRSSLLSLVDYDVSYGVLNIALLQGTYQLGSKTSLNMLIDHRLAPVMQTSNALINEANTSISSFLQQGMTEEQLRAQAEARTPTSDLIMIGATHNFNATWQLGGDIKRYNISGTPANGTPPATSIAAQLGTGDVYIYTLQGIATGLLTKRDVTVLSLSYLTSDTYDGESIAINNRTLLQDKWTLDLSLRYYQQKDNLGTDLTRLTPIMRVGYRWRDQITFEFEAGMEKGQTTSSTQTEDSTLNFYMIGYRWDF
jgi:tetratricopeptide (TPR) repeat protein